MKKISKKEKARIIICFLFIASLFVYTGTQLVNYITRINENNKTIKNLNARYTNLLLSEEKFQEEIGKLENPDYVAKYAREKYLYSKDGEIILRIIK